MATPLGKEHAEFDDEKEITTDLAQEKKLAAETRGPQAVPTERAERSSGPFAASDQSLANETRTTGCARLFPGGELEGLRTRWKQVQAEFVDQPRRAVEVFARRAVPSGTAVGSRG